MNYTECIITLIAMIHCVVLIIICTRWCQMMEVVSARELRNPPTASLGFPVARPDLPQRLRYPSDQERRAAMELELEIFPDHHGHGISDSDSDALPELISLQLQPLQPQSQLLMAVPTTTASASAKSNCHEFHQGPPIDPAATFVVIDMDNSSASLHNHSNERLIF